MFGDRLKKLRLARGLNQSEIAEELDMPQKTYSNYERNEREPSSTVLIKLGAYFGVSLDYLLGYHCVNAESPPPVKDEREAIKETLMQLDDKSLDELEKFIDYLIWKEEQG